MMFSAASAATAASDAKAESLPVAGRLQRAGCPLATIHAQALADRITFGFEADLNGVIDDALDSIVIGVSIPSDFDKATTRVRARTTVERRVARVANQTRGIHSVLPEGILL